MSTNSSFDALRGRRILIVEDDPAIGVDVGSILKGLGCRIVGPATCPQEALALIDERSPDAALLDIDLDGESAAPVAAALAERAVPFVVVSCASTIATREPALQQAPWIDKPYEARKILLALICALSRARTRFSVSAP